MKRARVPSVAAIITIAISLTLLGMTYVVGKELYGVINDIRSQVTLEVFLLPNATQSDRNELTEILETSQEVGSFEFISKEKAAERFQQEFGEDIYEILGENPLPISYTIEIAPTHRNSEAISAFVADLRRQRGVDEVRYHQTFLQLLDRYYNIALIVSAVILIVILGAAILLVANTIKLSIFAKREVIRIMRLVGATDLFIKTPFLVEGILHGIIGAGIALLLLSGLIAGTKYLFLGIVEMDTGLELPLIGGIITVGILFGLIGGARSIRMFLTDDRL